MILNISQKEILEQALYNYYLQFQEIQPGQEALKIHDFINSLSLVEIREAEERG